MNPMIKSQYSYLNNNALIIAFQFYAQEPNNFTCIEQCCEIFQVYSHRTNIDIPTLTKMAEKVMELNLNFIRNELVKNKQCIKLNYDNKTTN